MKFMIVTTIVTLGFFSAAGGAYAQTHANCYNPDNLGTVGQVGWTGCAGMYITDSTTLKAAADAGQTSGDYQISFDGTDYTFGDSDNDIFTGQVTTMAQLFDGNSNFNEDIGYWDTSSVTDMSGMFFSASIFDRDISQWDVSRVTNMRNMFVSALAFNQPLGDWDVRRVTDMNSMFWGAAVFDQPIGDWDVSRVTNMRNMFVSALAFNQPLGDWDVRRVTNMSGMFWNATVFDKPIGNWDVGSVTDMNAMFNGATIFNQDLTTWNVSQITSAPTNFALNSALTEANEPKWGTGIVVANFDGTLAEGGSTTFTVGLGTVPVADVLLTRPL